MPDVEVAAGVLPFWMQAVLRGVSETIQGTVVEAMTVRVTGGEIQPVRKPLGQGRLQAVVVGTGKVCHAVDVLQIRKLGGEGTDAVAVRIWSTLIEVAHTKQVIAVIADVTNRQR